MTYMYILPVSMLNRIVLLNIWIAKKYVKSSVKTKSPGVKKVVLRRWRPLVAPAVSTRSSLSVVVCVCVCVCVCERERVINTIIKTIIYRLNPKFSF